MRFYFIKHLLAQYHVLAVICRKASPKWAKVSSASGWRSVKGYPWRNRMTERNITMLGLEGGQLYMILYLPGIKGGKGLGLGAH